MKENRSKSYSNTESGFDFAKYLRLFKRKKWTILIIFLVVFALWMVFSIKFGPRPTYQTNALLQLEDRRELSATTMDSRGRPQNEAKLGLLMSRNFLGKVVDELSLQVKFKNINRSGVVDTVTLEEEYVNGRYLLKREKGYLQLFFSNPEGTIENKRVLEVAFPEDNTLAYDGFRFVFKPGFWDYNDELEFAIIKKAEAIEGLRSSLTPNFRNRDRTLLNVTIEGPDRFFIAKVLNVLIDEFIEQNLDVKKYRTREVLNILTEQLNTAKRDLDKAEEELKQFREKYPWVGLTVDASGVISGMSTYEAEKRTLENNITELDLLLSRYKSSNENDKYPILNEIITFLSAKGVPTAAALASEFVALTSERDRILDSYANTHQVVKENERKLAALEEKVLLTAENYKRQIRDRIQVAENKIQESNYKIRKLPARELQLAELQRRRSVADQIYETLLVRQNQAQIADAVEVGDIIILDPAVVPQSSSELKVLIRNALIGIILGLGFGFGFVLISNFLDKTVRTSDELEKIIPVRVLAKIPVIVDDKDITVEKVEDRARIDPKLVTADYSPTPVGEAYRSLRTQILFNDSEHKIKSFFVTSLNPGEGKSLNAGNIAITFAQQKLPTLIVDGDLRRGVLHHSFACKKKPGLSDFLYSNADITDENIRKIIQQTHIPNLYLLSSGMPIPNPSEILGSQRGRDVIQFLTKRFGFVIVDTPPIMVTSDAIIISQYVDSGLFVVRAGKSNVEQIKDKISEYKDFSKKLSGILLNFAKLDLKKSAYRYSYYNY